MTSVSLRESSGASTATKETREICIVRYKGSGVRPASYFELASGDGHGEEDVSVFRCGDKREGLIPSSWFSNGSLMGLLDLGVVQAIERHPPCRLGELRGFAAFVVVVRVSAGGRQARRACARRLRLRLLLRLGREAGSCTELYGAVRR